MSKNIIQITDMHLFKDKDGTLLGMKTWDSFNAVVSLVEQQHPKPDVMFLTGDLAQDEAIQTYQKLTDRLHIFSCPKYGIPGNHDSEDHMLTVFHEKNLQENRQLVIDNWNIILLNTQKREAVEGLLTDDELTFLNMTLGNYPEHHTLIFMHHPPVKVGSEWLDRLMLTNSDDFWTMIEPFHHVKGIFCGHVHQEFYTESHGIPVYTSPSTCFQFSRQSKTFGLEQIMPGYRTITLRDDGTFETSVFRVKDFELHLDLSSGGY